MISRFHKHRRHLATITNGQKGPSEFAHNLTSYKTRHMAIATWQLEYDTTDTSHRDIWSRGDALGCHTYNINLKH